ncbi:hypothetical protein HFP89_13105 [Wenzhouxiangella sp. XN79A]|uniref:hypothetical protein n=1 Tax=Wenzhouxiangella sp. XN79A TaxID=2724193 RepID=UPI00144A5094|nr:hypothetical protein [Wenzhouxiangella sp. XN79A]NKI36102.1 hypothetical protein [Wenzhouxiangella sp. XN79A]
MVRSIKAHFVLFLGTWMWLVGVQHASAQAWDGESSQAIRIADFGLEEQIPSAIDLVGPEHGAAGRSRAILAQRVQCWIDGLERCTFADRNDPRVRAVRRFLGLGPDDRDAAVIVHFPDRTQVQVRLVRAADPGPDTLIQSAYAPVVLADTARAPDLPTVPSQPGQLDGFAYQGTSEIRAALDRLKRRLEMPEIPAFALPAAEFSVD